MHIYALGDLHFSGVPERKPMWVFGAHWNGHREKIIENWRTAVTDEDVILLCGDTSWAMKLKEAVTDDLLPIAALPGKKVLLRGNHDYWWTSLKKMQAATDDQFFFLHNNFYAAGEVAVCGSRGWLTPSCEGYNRDIDGKILRHEEQRLRTSLEAARTAGYTDVILALHYPPFYAPQEESVFQDLIEEYGVKTCVFGHIHGAEGAASVFEGVRSGCFYKLVSCDTQHFTPVKIR